MGWWRRLVFTMRRRRRRLLLAVADTPSKAEDGLASLSPPLVQVRHGDGAGWSRRGRVRPLSPLPPSERRRILFGCRIIVRAGSQGHSDVAQRLGIAYPAQLVLGTLVAVPVSEGACGKEVDTFRSYCRGRTLLLAHHSLCPPGPGHCAAPRPSGGGLARSHQR